MHCVCKRYGDDDRDDYELSLADYESNQEGFERSEKGGACQFEPVTGS